MDDAEDHIRDLQKQKQQIQNEINDIQKSCKHEDVTLKPLRDEKGSTIVRWVCDTCNCIIRYPTEQEVQEYLGNEKQ